MYNDIFDELTGMRIDTQLYSDEIISSPSILPSNNTLIKKRDLCVEKMFNIEEDFSYTESILFDIFSPLIEKMINKKISIISCPKEVFLRRYGIKSDILDIYDSIISELKTVHCNKEISFVLFGGKLVDLVDSKSSGSNDFDLWAIDSSASSYVLPDSMAIKTRNNRFIETSFNGHKIQIMDTIKREDGGSDEDVSIEDVLKCFDFRHCAIAFDGERFYWIKNTIKDILLKRMVINKFIPSKTIGLRISKYCNRGFKISIPDFTLASILQLSAVKMGDSVAEKSIFTDRNYDIETMHQLAEQLYESV